MRTYFCLLLVCLFLAGCSETRQTAAVPVTAPSTPTAESSQNTEAETVPLPPAWTAYYEDGLSKMAQEDWETAAEAFTSALALEPENATLLAKRGDCFARMGRDENLSAARADYQAVLAQDPKSPEAHLGLADIQIREYDFDGALETLEAASRLATSDALTQKLEAHRKGNIQDSSGRFYFRTGYDEAGNRVWYHVFQYHNAQDYSVTAYNNAGEEISAAEHRVDAEGRVTRSYSYHAFTGLLNQQEHQYDDQGRVAREDVYDADGQHLSYTLFLYGDSGQVFRRECYSTDGVLDEIYEYVYDDKGRETERRRLDGNEVLLSYAAKEYNDLDLMTSETLYSPDGTPGERTVLEYDENGRLIRYTVYDPFGDVVGVYSGTE